jgi:hypothetical protein
VQAKKIKEKEKCGKFSVPAEAAFHYSIISLLILVTQVSLQRLLLAERRL